MNSLESRRRLLKALMYGSTFTSSAALLSACGGGGGGSPAAGSSPAPVSPSASAPATPAFRRGGVGRFAKVGPLQPPNAQGVMVPAGFSARVVAQSGQPLGASGLPFHVFPDGGGVMPAADGSGDYFYLSNSEVPGAGSAGFTVSGLAGVTNTLPPFVPGLGGTGAIRFGRDGQVKDHYPILGGTTFNCAGVVTPWGTFLSCEEYPQGRVWEVDPRVPLRSTAQGAATNLVQGVLSGAAPLPSALSGSAVARPTLGVFSHEAVAIDAVRKRLYLTEDMPDGRLYRWLPADSDWRGDRPALQAGTLQVMAVQGPVEAALKGPVPFKWLDALNPTQPQDANRHPDSTVFVGGEGIWYRQGLVFFTTKGDDRVWQVDDVAGTVTCIYDRATAQGPNDFLSGVDNITMTEEGDLLVAEDGGNMQVVVIQPDGSLVELLRIVDNNDQAGSYSEIAGLAFSPDRQRLYFTSDRGGMGPTGHTPGLGLVYELVIPPGV